MTVLVLLVALFLFLLIGVPVAVSLGLASILTMLLFGDQSLVSLSQKFFHIMWNVLNVYQNKCEHSQFGNGQSPYCKHL